LVASIPAPRCDHRQHQDAALAQQALIDTRIVPADFFGRMGEVEFDRSAATRLEIYEQQPVLRGEHIARVRLAVQQLLGAAAFADPSSDACISPTIELSSARPHLSFPGSAGLTCQCGIPSRHRLLIKVSTTDQHQQVLGRDPYLLQAALPQLVTDREMKLIVVGGPSDRTAIAGAALRSRKRNAERHTTLCEMW
jgi:hypothetical protein